MSLSILSLRVFFTLQLIKKEKNKAWIAKKKRARKIKALKKQHLVNESSHPEICEKKNKEIIETKQENNVKDIDELLVDYRLLKKSYKGKVCRFVLHLVVYFHVHII